MPQTATQSPQCARYILDAARDLLAEVGYGAMSMRQLASRAGLLPGSLYHHVAGKQELLLYVLLDLHQQRDAAWKARSRATSKAGKLRAFIAFVLDRQAANPAESLILEHEVRHLPGEQRQWLERHAPGLGGQLQRLLERDGLPRREAQDAAVAIMALLGGAHALRQLADTWNAPRLHAHFHQLALRLLGVTSSATETL
ncbi:TetR/AcrR family transcriptional regulator [Pseudomonas sp. 148P]|uniref:TetR/AcrR family transcriptional regulator n=1 Tax=Pseudomonas ulcerans TaxID=3115852 RepID=A0ABU7I034_9PSED|nr:MULTISPECIES: TetR/AcrR family transcriptional regulator [unclassified Pseudomonas]MEE1925968.1 TetR/AcrR family transcriptional regulator [Pseudomonas sp. 147P]MEE1937192.1 TetR/AcrR family transcriptional regulator [Pseudomonas sp. 148P]